MSHSDDARSTTDPAAALPAWATNLQYETSFDETKQLVVDAIHAWYPNRETEKLDLAKFEGCVAIKDHNWVVVAESPAVGHFFTVGISATGRGAEAIAFKKSAVLTQSTDQLIRDGVHSLEFDHVGRDLEGRLYTIHSMKLRLSELKDPNYYLLAISRPTSFIGMSEEERKFSLNELLIIFQNLDEVDQTISHLDAAGETTKDIAARVGLTSRSIEMRRKKMMETFKVHRPMELIRITIRLQEHGLLPH